MQVANKLFLFFASASLGLGAVAQSYAQDTKTESDAAAIGASSAEPSKAQRKQAAKEARAKRTAELKKLEGAGYKSGGASDPHKAGIEQGASQ
jgi:hypothetical protein